MAEDEQQNNPLATVFPAPPPFYKHFTRENKSELQRLRDEASERTLAEEKLPSTVENGALDGESEDLMRDAQEPSLKIDELPLELRHLIPPDPPREGHYRSFGDLYDIGAPLPTLSSQGIPQVYASSQDRGGRTPQQSASTVHHPIHLINLTRSILLTYLSLVDILATNPSQYSTNIDDLRTLFFNAHHLVNEYRPHQARQTLIGKMEDKLKARKREVQETREVMDRVRETMRELEEEAENTKEKGASNEDVEARQGFEDARRKQEEEKRIWTALEAIGT